MDSSQQYCLRWKYHHSNLQAMFSLLLERGCFCDVTLACEGKTLKAHKVMLSACSTYFDSIFSQYEDGCPIVILKDVRYSDLKALIQFMYKGEINVDNSELTSLLKTAEELKIKGLAEVSWRSGREVDDSCEEDEEDDDEDEEDADEDNEPPAKKSRHETSNAAAKDSADAEEYQEYVDENLEEEVDNISGDEECGFVIDETPNASLNNSQHEELLVRGEKKERDFTSSQQSSQGVSVTSNLATNSTSSGMSGGSGGSSIVDEGHGTDTAYAANMPDLSQYSDIMKMNDYLEQGGRRPQFWEEPFTKRLMEAIKNKEVEMKVAAELMGVSYGTLYGRYRDAYGCLKHPYRVRDFWSEQGPAEILAKLQRKELTLFRAAELLNVTVTTLANYLSTLKPGGNSSSDNEEITDIDEADEEKRSVCSSSTPQ